MRNSVIYTLLATLLLIIGLSACSSDVTTPDERLFDLRGPVSESTIIRKDSLGEARTIEHIEFNDMGSVTLDPFGNVYYYDSINAFTDGNHFYTEIKRDDKGRLTCYLDERGGEGTSLSVIYDEGGNPLSFKIEEPTETEIIEIRYDNEGNRVAISREHYDMSNAGAERSDETYQIVDKDKRGNWTIREVTVTYEIDYVYYDSEGKPVGAVATGTERFTDTRNIKYRD